jgi:hypothetical protein
VENAKVELARFFKSGEILEAQDVSLHA